MKKKQKQLKIKEKPNWYIKYFKTKRTRTIEGKSDDNEKHSKYKEVSNKISNERISEMYNISKEIDFNNLNYDLKVQILHQ